MAFQSVSTSRGSAARISAFSLAKTCSKGFMSGE
jgi:hypothetical protein